MSSAGNRPSGQPTPPKWRSSLSTTKRQRPAASVSLVFAQPEQGAKLSSAIDRLPVVGLDDAASFMSESSRKRERLSSNASSFVSQAEPHNEYREGQIGLRDGKDVSRKRSKLNMDVHEEPLTDIGTGGNGRLTADVQGSASNPVDLTESPQPMESALLPSGDIYEGKSDTSAVHSQKEATIPFPATEVPKNIRTVKPTPSRSSWFDFSRAKGSSNEPNTDVTSSAPAPSTAREVTASPAIAQSEQPDGVERDTEDLSSSSPAGPASLATSPPRAIPSADSPMAFSSVQYSPPADRLKSNTTSISSVDEEVPIPRISGLDSSTATLIAQAVVEPQDTRAAGRKPSVSSLNPSTSRFTLRLPLLGRPKVPLEQAVASAQAEDISTASPDTATTGDDPSAQAAASAADSDTLTTTVEEPEADPQVINVLPPTPDQQPPQAALSQPTPQEEGRVVQATDGSGDSVLSRPASWWDYVGWGGHHTDGQAKPAEEKSDATENATPTDGAAHLSTSPVVDEPTLRTVEHPPAPDAAVPTVTDAAIEANGAAETTLVPRETQDAKSDGRPISTLSAGSIKSHEPSWYSPWSWYASPAAAPGAVGTGMDPSADAKGVQMTESERVKEEALAREQAQDDLPSSAPESAAAPEREVTPEPSNPIHSSIAENRSGWMSFFTSRALTVKAVTNEESDKNEGGMEVMEIDDDDEPEPDVAVEVTIPPSPSKAKDIPRQATASSKPSALSLFSTSPKPSSPIPSSPAAGGQPKTPTSKTPKSPTVPTREREPKSSDPAVPLTDSESVKRDARRGARTPSPTPSKATTVTTPPNSAKPAQPNFVLPAWGDTFHTAPRSQRPPRAPSAKSKLTGALSYVAGALFSEGAPGKSKAKGKGKGKLGNASGMWSSPAASQDLGEEFVTFGRELPKALDVVGEQLNPYILNGGCRVVVIGVAGWSPGAVTRTLAGGLPSSSSKFVNMTVQALEQFAEESGFKFKKITPMPLEGDGTIRKKVSRVYNHLVDNEEWMEDLHAADVIFVASHSQGAIVSTHLIDRLIEDGHILTSRSVDTLAKAAVSLAAGGVTPAPTSQAQKICFLALCGVHLGPLRYLKTSSLLQPYIQYVENAAARELFEFQDTESKASKNYVGALRNVLDHGTKVAYIASLNDQVVPIYSGLFTAASHPRILRALYIDSDAYHSSDFLSNLLILLIRIINAGLSDRGLLAHLSEATAGTLSGVGHSTAYEEPATYSLAVKYFFMTNEGGSSDAELVIHPFNAVEEQNDYEIPWLLRDMIADNKISHFFAHEFAQLRDAFDDWQPKTTILRDVKKKLQPITRLSTTTQQASSSISKL